jgi:hypothetical protein
MKSVQDPALGSLVSTSLQQHAHSPNETYDKSALDILTASINTSPATAAAAAAAVTYTFAACLRNLRALQETLHEV